jgi:predicted nucleic acid-binding protein
MVILDGEHTDSRSPGQACSRDPRNSAEEGIEPEAALAVLAELAVLIGCIDAEIYGRFETAARQRLQGRDEEDWPVLATVLALECPIWTEDADFFGAGVATWTTDRVELLLREAQQRDPAEPETE